MHTRLHKRLHAQEGFTLIELLVVILIIGILAAIAIPAFLNQKGKGSDAAAKSNARSAQTALETYYTDNNTYDCSTAPVYQSYATGCDSALHQIEPSLPKIVVSGATAGQVQVAGTTGTSYTIDALSNPDGRDFQIQDNGGTFTRTCIVPPAVSNRGGCPTSGKW